MQLKVLIIEDNDDDAALIGYYLKSCGFDPKWQKVDCEEDLANAVEDRRWDLVLCDFSMPELTPFIAVDCVRRVNPDIPFIIVTGAVPQNSAEDLVAQLLQQGVQDVILKDNLPRLKKVISRELALVENRREKVAAELRLAAALEKLSQGVALYDQNAQLITCNKQYKLSLDLCKDEIVPGTSYPQLLELAVERGQFLSFGKSTEQTEQCLFTNIAATGEQPLEIQHHNGRWFEVERHHTEGGGIITVKTDITEKKQREEALMRNTAELARINDDLVKEIDQRTAIEAALRESENRARAIFESAVDGVITFNEEFLIETLNPAAEKMFGYSAEELKGLHIHHIMLLGDSGSEQSPANGHTAAEQQDFRNASLINGWRKNGESFPVELTISQVKLSNCFIYTGIIRDVTERTKLDRMKSEFVSVVSHELRTPLTSIRGSLSLLTTNAVGELPPRAKSMISIGLQNSERLLRLINDILDMEKIESGMMEYRFEPINARKLIEAAIEEHRTYLDQYNLHIRVECREGLNIMVRGDNGRLIQVLANLLSNAAKYSPEGGTVTVGIIAQAKKVRIWVQDEGPGLPETFRETIFQKFTQADSSDTRQKGGTGLGLSIAKAIVEHHGGTIDFMPGKDGGTRFFFDLPIYLAEVYSEQENQFV